MGDRLFYWIHGISVQVQSEDLIEEIFRGGEGARIRQNSGGNWFQIPLPTPTILGSNPAEYIRARLRGEINEQATITKVHIWHGGKPRGRIIWRKDDYSLSEREIDETFDLPNQRCRYPLAMSIWVNFDEGGEIWFAGAGVYFRERT